MGVCKITLDVWLFKHYDLLKNTKNVTVKLKQKDFISFYRENALNIDWGPINIVPKYLIITFAGIPVRLEFFK